MRKYNDYKDSEIEWIGQIPKHWNLKKIKHTTYVKGRIGWQGLRSDEFLEIGDSYVVTGTDFERGRINWETCYQIAKSRYDEDPYIQLKENDLLITKDGTIGKIALVKDIPTIATLNSGVFVTRPQGQDYLTQYLFWVLQSDMFTSFINHNKSGSTISHLYQNVFNEFKFTCPPISEQIHISKYLNYKNVEIDKLIADKEKLIELLNEERIGIINQAVTKGINPHAPMKDSGIEWLGDVPEHWSLKKMRFVFTCLNTMRVPLNAEERAAMTSRMYDYYGASGVIDKVENFLFDEPLILIGEDGANLLTRSKRLAFIAEGQYWVNNHAHILKPLNGNINYLCELLEIIDYSIYVSGSAQPKLTKEALLGIEIIEPPILEQTEIFKYIEAEEIRIYNIIDKVTSEIDLLKEYKTALISEVLTGKVDIRHKVISKQPPLA